MPEWGSVVGHQGTNICMAEGRRKDQVKICVLGASFDTGNLGVNALAESSIKILLHRWPSAEIVLFGSGRVPANIYLRIGAREVTLPVVPVRFSKDLLLPYHFLRFVLSGVAARVLPWRSARRMVCHRNPYCRALHEADWVADITGGDSFSDIYGMRRFILGFLRKWLVLLYGRRLVMLPQTYGPFNRGISRFLAKYVLNRAEAIYSRDEESIEYLKSILDAEAMARVRFLPDVAFVLDSNEPADLQIQPDDDLRARGSLVVGFNISGLLYNGGYTRTNMFRLKADYCKLVHAVAEMLLRRDDVSLLLVPHVLPGKDMEVESDPAACRRVFDDLSVRYNGRVFLAAGQYNHSQIKHVIGLCDFFIGSRMHACIAALSQGIPAVGLAYSRKFRGVFDAVGGRTWVVDLRSSSEQAVLDAVSRILDERQAATETLRVTVPAVQRRILGMFANGSGGN
ncbi:MAG: hypothetical protein A2Y76_15580 [Planctomycetes bacterium RBG_13_60_9]|nr:MAG: hypothetical protein A2Y76_15580 [Planctomycetes bacterium RBG_13_60_9]